MRRFRKFRNIGLLWAKVRRFCHKSTDVLCKEVRCFPKWGLVKFELSYHTDNHGCTRTTWRIVLAHGHSRMATNDMENYIITRTFTDGHGRHGELYYHTDIHGCTRTTRRIILSHGHSRMATDGMENYIITRTFTDAHGELLYDQQLKGHAPNALSSCPRCLGCPSCR